MSIAFFYSLFFDLNMKMTDGKKLREHTHTQKETHKLLRI